MSLGLALRNILTQAKSGQGEWGSAIRWDNPRDVSTPVPTEQSPKKKKKRGYIEAASTVLTGNDDTLGG